MNIDEYTAIITESFSFLFEEYNFNIVYRNEYRPEYDWYVIGLESPKCRIMFIREQGAGAVFIGESSSPFGNEPSGSWVSLLGILNYLRKSELDWSFVGKVPFSDQTKAGISFEANEIKPFINQILDMFVSPEAISKWKSNYNEYARKTVEQKYGISNTK
jgi:hypothetical protein